MKIQRASQWGKNNQCMIWRRYEWWRRLPPSQSPQFFGLLNRHRYLVDHNNIQLTWHWSRTYYTKPLPPINSLILLARYLNKLALNCAQVEPIFIHGDNCFHVLMQPLIESNLLKYSKMWHQSQHFYSINSESLLLHPLLMGFDSNTFVILTKQCY